MNDSLRDVFTEASKISNLLLLKMMFVIEEMRTTMSIYYMIII